MAAPGVMSVAALRAGLRWPTAQDLLFSVKTMIAVAVALLIGFSQDLDNPYWSGLTIYVLVAQPQAGAIRSKALFRLAGTLVGGWTAIGLAALFASHVGVLLIAMLLVVTGTLYLKLLDRTPANYLWFATSLTVAVIGVLHVQSPDTIWYYGVTRMGEIALGILCIGIVDSLFAPRPQTPAFVEAMTGWRDTAADWAASALASDASNEPDARWQRRKGLRGIAAGAAPLDAQGVQLPWDVVARPPSRRAVRLLRLLVARVMAELASANVWVEAARATDAPAARVDALMGQVRDWLGEKPPLQPAPVADHAARGDALRQALADEGDALAADTAREPVAQATTLARLGALVADWAMLEQSLAAVAAGTALPRPLRRLAAAARPVRSIDLVPSALDMLPVVLALGAVGAFWYASAWTSGLNALLFVYIICGFITGTPGTVSSARGAMIWLTLAYGFTFLYEFAILPRVTAFPVLIAVLASALVPLGLVVAMAPAGLLITANIFGDLGLQNAYAADFGSSLQSLAGSVAGCLVAVAALYLCAYDRSRLVARRLAHAMSRDVAEAGTAWRTPDHDRYVSLSVDRLSLFLSATAELAEDDPLRRQDLVARFRAGANLVSLRAAARALPADLRAALRDLVRAVAAAFGRADAPDPQPLLDRVEQAYDRVAASPPGLARREALAALTGLRLALRPDPAFAALLGRSEA